MDSRKQIVLATVIIIVVIAGLLFAGNRSATNASRSTELIKLHSFPTMDTAHSMRFGVARIVASVNELLVLSASRQGDPENTQESAKEEEEELLTEGFGTFLEAFKRFREHHLQANKLGVATNDDSLVILKESFEKLNRVAREIMTVAEKPFDPVVVAELKEEFEQKERDSLSAIEVLLMDETAENLILVDASVRAVKEMELQTLAIGIISVVSLLIYAGFVTRAFATESAARQNEATGKVALEKVRDEQITLNEELARHRDNLEDIVEERTRQLQEALATEKEAHELQRQFIAMVTHEFRTPLTIIDGSAQHVMRQGRRTDDERLVGRGEKIRHAINRLKHLMEGVLFTGSLEAGNIGIKVENYNFGKLLEEICDDHRAIGITHTLELQIGEIPPLISCDPRVLYQAFSNLLSNATKYSPGADRVVLSAERRNGGIEVSVQDFGIGIPSRDLGKMFMPYARATNTAGISGTGLGLNLVKTLVEMHGGTVGVESVEGEGSTFTVWLPIGSLM